MNKRSALLHKTIKKLIVIFVLVFIASKLVLSAAAMDFSVTPEFPENQRNSGSSFFDLLVYPGQEQELVIVVHNISEKDIVVLVELITATTSRNGQINYTSRGLQDETITHSFEDIATLPQSHYDIPAESSTEVRISLSVPNEPFDGAILGSIRVLREVTQEERDAGGAIVNQFASVTAVRLVQSEGAEDIPADFALGSISAELINYRASIVAHVRNTQPRIIKNATATARIFQQNNNQMIFEYTLDPLDFAPNSVFPFSFIDEGGYGIDAGFYTAHIDIEYGGRVWNFVQDFEVTQQEASAVNESAVNQHGQHRPAPVESQAFPLWGIIAIAVGVAILAAIIVLIIVLTRRRSPYPFR